MLANIERAIKRSERYPDLAGHRFDMLTVREDSGQRRGGYILWRCQCDCGGEVLRTRGQLTSGSAVNCGCERKNGRYARRDLTGRRFGRLTALYPVKKMDRGKASSACWRCRCDCGREVDVYSASLLHGLTRSCGCLNHEHRTKMHEYMHYGDDTCIERLVRAQKNEGNKTGFRGLTLMRNGKYRASITFRKVHYSLGCYSDFDEAVQVRLDAEKTLHQGYIDAYGTYQRMAAADPAWAERNPFYYDVQRTDGRFTVLTNGMKPAPEPVPARRETGVV